MLFVYKVGYDLFNMLLNCSVLEVDESNPLKAALVGRFLVAVTVGVKKLHSVYHERIGIFDSVFSHQ